MSNELQVYRELGREPATALSFVKEVGASLRGGLKGCGTPGAATAAALTMLTEGLTPPQFEAKYHCLDGGGLQLKSTWMLAELERLGYQPRWLEDGENGQRATLCITKNGTEHSVSFTIDQAKAKGLVKPKSTWQVDSPLMLRARAIGRCVDMHAPEIRSGSSDDDFETDAESPAMADAAKRGRPAKGKESAAATATTATAAPSTATAVVPEVASPLAGKTEDAEFTPAATEETHIETPFGKTEGGELISDAEVEEIRRLAASEQRLYQTAKFVIEKIFEVQVPIQELSAMQGKWLLIYLYFDLLKIDGPTQSKGLAKMGVSEVYQLDKAKAESMLAALRKRCE